MKLLMLDDEEYVLESIRKNVDWEQQGIREIYSASSMKQAQRIMEMVPIDIIISDIVMPMQSGFDFIHWVRDNKYTVQVIFLTSYAEFDYARHAIAMSSIDYLLKPIDYDKLAAAVGKAAEKVTEARKSADDRTESRLWRQNQSLLRREFWMELLRGNRAGDALLCYTEETEFLLLYLTFNDGVKSQSAWDEKTLYFIMENVLSEMLEGFGYLVEAVVPNDKGSSVTVCRKAAGNVQTVDRLKDKGVFERFIHWMGERLQMNIWCGVGSPGRADALSNSFALLQDMRDNSLSIRNRVLYQSDFEVPETSLQNPNLTVWKALLEQIRQYIDVHYKEEIRRDSLGELVYLNTDYISRIFKKETGISISSYILKKRVEEAKKLLAQSNLPINTVSIYVGYSNFSYFTKMFKENTGYSPLDYRRKFRQI